MLGKTATVQRPPTPTTLDLPIPPTEDTNPLYTTLGKKTDTHTQERHIPSLSPQDEKCIVLYNGQSEKLHNKIDACNTAINVIAEVRGDRSAFTVRCLNRHIVQD